MCNSKTATFFGTVLLVASIVTPPVAAAPDGAATEKQRMIEKGLQHVTAWALYQALKEEAGGGKRLTWENIPDWSGVYMRSRGGFYYDPDQPIDGVATAKLTPEYHAKMMAQIERINQGIEFDIISANEVSPGHPRWLTLPFLRDHVVTPDQTWMIAEAYNSVRRIYTDGRGHLPEDEFYPVHNGDSIGFWDEQRLVIHTNQLMAHFYERTQPDYTAQVEVVEIWQKVDANTLEAHVWVYDPPVLVEPWYTKQTYAKVNDPEKVIRIHFYEPHGNPNSFVYMKEDGTSDFVDLQFTDEDD